MDIRRVPVHQINPAPYNPRQDLKPGDPAYEQLKRSLTQFGCVEPLVWNRRTGHLVGGHQRFKVLLEQGVAEVDVSIVDLPLEQEKALNIALNKITGDWDEAKLAALLQELGQIPEFDVGLTGFEPPEISELLDRQQEVQEDAFDVEAAVAAIDTPITQPGDLIELGPHRLLCGDSANPDDLKRLMDGQQADVLDCDFPYNVNYLGGDQPNPNARPKQSRKWQRIYSDDMPQADYEAWMRTVLTNVKSVLKPGAAIYIWQGHRQFPPMYQILLELGFHVSSVLCWMKECAALSYADYSFQTEQCLYGWLLGASHYWAGPPGASNLWQIKRDPTKTYCHPTQKPVALGVRALKNSSRRGDLVLDTFLGSGSLLLACESLGRRCRGIELDPKYCDVIVRRYLAFVGKDRVSAELQARYCQEASHESV